MKTITKIFIGLAIAAAVVVGIVLWVGHNDWPWWAGVAIGLGLLGLVLAVFFVRKWLFRRNQRKFIQHVTADEEADLDGGRDQRPLVVLEERWKEAVASLRRSRLSKRGKPLYVLPWYLILGERGSGKTAAIKSSRLHSALTEVSQSSAESGTKNCDWWFFDKAVLLDTAGRYAVPEDEIQDKAEWQRFLLLLARYRRREPINGLILTVGADKLLAGDPDALADQGRILRRRIDELMRVFGVRFPVYLLVTKMDRVFGLTALCDLLDDDALGSAMGQANTSLNDDSPGLVDEACEGLSERLKDLRLRLLARKELQDPSLLMLPEQLDRLQPNLKRFVDAAFEKNPYQEPPLLRGIYFSSARQESTAAAPPGALATFGPTDRKGPPGFEGIFLRDFFDRILPGDRNLSTPIAEYLRWQRWTRNLGLLAELAIALFLAGLLSLSFAKNLGTINSFRAVFDRSPTLTRDPIKDVVLLKEFKRQIDELSSLNAGWLLPRMGLDASLTMEATLKDEYCRLFARGFLVPLDRRVQQAIADFSAATPAELVVILVEHLASRIRLLTTRLEQGELEEVERIPEAIFSDLTRLDPDIMPEVAAKKVLPFYLTYLRWNGDDPALHKERTQLTDGLKQLALTKGTTLNWLVSWANLQNLRPARLEDFWGDRVQSGHDIRVLPAFTEQGRERIEQFLAQYESAVQDPEILSERKAQFYDWYKRKYVDAWRRLAEHFEPDRLRFESEVLEREAVQILTEADNPYFVLLQRMSKELQFVSDLERLPTWVDQVIAFRKVKAWADKPELGAKAAKLGGAGKLVDKVGGAQDQLGDVQQIAQEGDRLKSYQQGLAGLAPLAASSVAAFKMVSQLYTDSALSPLQTAHNGWSLLRRLHRKAGKDNLYLKLMSGPYRFLLSFALREATAELQARWDAMVRAEVKDVPANKRTSTLFDASKGVVWKFVRGPAAAFLSKGPNGYYTKAAMGRKFPFVRQFLTFLNKGHLKGRAFSDRYEVTLKALPTSVNRGAVLEPHSTVLTLECQSGRQKLENYNFPVERKFVWEPDNCGEVALRIHFRDFSLHKRYSKQYAFSDFIAEFRGGSRIFSPADFPGQQRHLGRMQVGYIKVKYAIQGAGPILEVKRKGAMKPAQMPDVIVRRSDPRQRNRFGLSPDRAQG